MKCEKIETSLIEYIEGNLSSEETRELDTHLAECESCELLVAKSRQLWSGLDLVDDLEVPDTFYIKIRQKLNFQSLEKVSWLKRAVQLEKIFVPTLATGMVLTGLLIGNFLGNSIYQNVATNDSTEISAVTDYFKLDYFDSTTETDLLSGFTQSLQALGTSTENN